METCRSCNQFLIICLCPPGGHPPSKTERTVRAEDSKRRVMAVMRKRSCPSEETKLYPKDDEKEKEMPVRCHTCRGHNTVKYHTHKRTQNSYISYL